MFLNQHRDTKSPVKSQIPSLTSCVEKPQHLLKDIRVLGRKDAKASLSVTELELLTAASHDVSTASSIADDCCSASPGRLRRKEVLSQASLTSSDFKTQPENQRRGRPVKPHEAEPFLQVDATAHGKRISLQHDDTSNNKEKQQGWCVKTGLEARQTPAYSESHASAFCRPYSSPTPSLGSRSRDQRSPSNIYVSSNIPASHPNIHVKTPFKHNIHKPRDTEKTKLKSPSQNLKELTAVATSHISRILAAYSGNEPVQSTGHLLKGRLKPLYPVAVTGPKIEHCRGILSETRSYCPSASRTFQRRRQIMMQLKSGDRRFSALSLCQQKGFDSVHRVSAASSAEDWVSNSGEEKESVEDDGDAEIEINEKETCEIMLEQFCQDCPKEDKHPNEGEASNLAMGDITQLQLQTVIDENQGLTYLTQREMHHSCSWKEQSASWAQRNTSKALASVSDASSTEASYLAAETSDMADKLSDKAIKIAYMASDASEMTVGSNHDQKIQEPEGCINCATDQIQKCKKESGGCVNGASDHKTQKCKKKPGGCVNSVSDAVKDMFLSNPSHLFQHPQRSIKHRTSHQLWRARGNHQPLISSAKTVQCPDLNLSVANSPVPSSRYRPRWMAEKKKNGSQLTCKPKDRQKIFSDKSDCKNSVPHTVPARSAYSVNYGGQSGVGETNTCGGMVALFKDLQTPHKNKQCQEDHEDMKLLSLTAKVSQTCTSQQINGCGVKAFLKMKDDPDVVGLQKQDFSCAADTVCTQSDTVCTQSESVCTQPDSVCTQPDSVCTQPDSGCTQSDSVCTQSESVCTQSEIVCTQSESVCTKSDSVCTKSDSVCTQSNSVCTKSDSVCTKSDSVCTQSNSVCTKSDSICTQSESVCTQSDSVCTKSDSVCTQSASVCSKSYPKADKEHKVFSMQSQELDSSSENTQSSRDVGINALTCHKGSSCSSSRRAPGKENLLKLLLEDAESGVESCASHLYEDNTSDFTSCISSAESDLSQCAQHTFPHLNLTASIVGDSGKTCEKLCASFISSEEGKPGEVHRICDTDLERHPVGMRVDVGELSSCAADCLHETLAAGCLHGTVTRTELDDAGRSRSHAAHCSLPASCLPEHVSVTDKKKKIFSNKQHSTLTSVLKNIGKSENNSFMKKCNVFHYNAVKEDPAKLDIKQRLNYSQPKSQVCHQIKGVRHVFTHHSTHPFICPSNDSFSLSVARHLKFGDSPYLKELNVKTGRRSIRTPIGKEKCGEGKGDHVFNAKCLLSTSSAHLPNLQSSVNHHICCPSAVSFANCSSEMIDVKQNCSLGEEPCGVDQSVLVSGQ